MNVPSHRPLLNWLAGGCITAVFAGVTWVGLDAWFPRETYMNDSVTPVSRRSMVASVAAEGFVGKHADNAPVDGAITPPSPILTPSVDLTSAAPISQPPPVAISAFPRDLVIVAPVGNVPLPVAFQPLAQDAEMSPEKHARLDAIQEQFLTAIGGPSQDPTSPAYLDAWRKAQRDADAQFKIAFGQTEFIRRSMASLRAQRAASATP